MALKPGTASVAGRPPGHWIGPLLAVVGVFGFSAKAILVKLAYAWHPVDAVTLLALRMIYSAPLFVAMAWWTSRPPARRLSMPEWRRLALIGFIGYYLSSLLDFMGLAYITAALERLILYLYPTFVVLLSALLLGKPITRRAVAALALSYAGIVLVFTSDLRVTGAPGDLAIGAALVFVCSVLYALYLVLSGDIIGRIGSVRFVSWAMLASTVFVLAQFAATRDPALLAVPPRIHLLSAAMAVFSTVLPVWMVAEAVRRIGANASSLIGSLGPVFTIGLGASILGEPLRAVQLVGAALVLVGVALVTLRAAPESGTPASRARDGLPPES